MRPSTGVSRPCTSCSSAITPGPAGCDADAGIGRDLGLDLGAAFVARIRPAQGLAIDLGQYLDIERMRFADDAAGHQAAIGLRLERVVLGDVAQALEPDFDRARGRRQRLVALVQPGLVLGRRAVLGDGQLDGVAVLFEQAPAVLALLRFLGSRRVRPPDSWPCSCRAFRFAAAGGEQQGERQCADQWYVTSRGRSLWGRLRGPATKASPVRRWISMSARCASSAASSCCLRRGGAFGLQLRPFEVADRAGAVGALGGGFGLRQLRQHVVLQTLRPRPARRGSGRAPRPASNTATVP